MELKRYVTISSVAEEKKKKKKRASDERRGPIIDEKWTNTKNVISVWWFLILRFANESKHIIETVYSVIIFYLKWQIEITKLKNP